MKLLILGVVIGCLSGCGATLKSYESLSTPTGVSQSASIGSELYRIKKQKDLPNAFGKADIFGGKVDAGYTELRFMGLTPDGHVVFRLTDIDIESNETTVNRYGGNRSTINSNTSANASSYGNTAYGTANTTTTITTYQKPSANVTQLPPNTVEFTFDPAEKALKMEAVTVEVLEVTKYSINYILRR